MIDSNPSSGGRVVEFRGKGHASPLSDLRKAQPASDLMGRGITVSLFSFVTGKGIVMANSGLRGRIRRAFDSLWRSSWLEPLRRPTLPPRRGRRACRLRLEPLEERRLLTAVPSHDIGIFAPGAPREQRRIVSTSVPGECGVRLTCRDFTLESTSGETIRSQPRLRPSGCQRGLSASRPPDPSRLADGHRPFHGHCVHLVQPRRQRARQFFHRSGLPAAAEMDGQLVVYQGGEDDGARWLLSSPRVPRADGPLEDREVLYSPFQ